MPAPNFQQLAHTLVLEHHDRNLEAAIAETLAAVWHQRGQADILLIEHQFGRMYGFTYAESFTTSFKREIETLDHPREQPTKGCPLCLGVGCVVDDSV